MDQKDLEKKETSFRLSSGKKYGNGSYFLAFTLLSYIFTNYYENTIEPHSLSAVVSFIVFAIGIFLDTGAMYFLVLWIADVIRRKRKTGKPESKKFRLVVNIIFVVIFLFMLISFSSILKPSKTPELNLQETSFMTEFQEKTETFVIKSDELKVAMQGFMDVLKSQDMSKMHQTLQSVQNASLALQPEIEKQKIFIQQNLTTFQESDGYKKQFFEGYAKAIDVRDRHNKKLAELATYGLKINWNNPIETQWKEWSRIADELAVIEKELQATQLEFQTIIQAQKE